ncbi:MAG: NUDIX domain-containing protein [Chitinophagales bacterium]
MYKLFINNKVVYITQNPASVENILQEEYIIERYSTKANLETLLTIILGDANSNNVILFHKDVDELLELVLSYFKSIEAAGGVVRNHKHEILLIFRRGFWDLPKGKIEKNENIESAAVREVEEETGLQQVEILQPIYFTKCKNKTTFHSYELKGKQCMKITHWFEMKTNQIEKLIPQTEEDIEQAVWVSEHRIPEYFSMMYPNIVDVLKEILPSN